MPYNDPKYPVINPHPTVDDCIKSMRVRDYLVLGGATTGSWVYGYLGGKPVRMATAGTAAALGFTFVSFILLQDTRGRFMGYNENTREVKKYGAHPTAQPPQYPPQDKRFPTATGHVSDTVRPPLDWKNY